MLTVYFFPQSCIELSNKLHFCEFMNRIPKKLTITLNPAYNLVLNLIGQDYTWPTPNNVTEVEAFQKCKTTVEANVAFQGCKNVPDIGFSVSLDSCVIDIQVKSVISSNMCIIDIQV